MSLFDFQYHTVQCWAYPSSDYGIRTFWRHSSFFWLWLLQLSPLFLWGTAVLEICIGVPEFWASHSSQKLKSLFAIVGESIDCLAPEAYTPNQSAPTILVLKTWVGLWPWKNQIQNMDLKKARWQNQGQCYLLPVFFQVHILDLIFFKFGGFQLLDLIIPELKSHVIPYKFKCSHWWKIHL